MSGVRQLIQCISSLDNNPAFGCGVRLAVMLGQSSLCSTFSAFQWKEEGSRRSIFCRISPGSQQHWFRVPVRTRSNKNKKCLCPTSLTLPSFLVCCWQDLWAGDRPSSDGAYLRQWSVAGPTQSQAWSVQGKLSPLNASHTGMQSSCNWTFNHAWCNSANLREECVWKKHRNETVKQKCLGLGGTAQSLACSLKCLFPRPW